MTQHVMTTATMPTPFWRRRTFIALALVVVLAVGVVAAIRSVLASDSSVASRSETAPLVSAAIPAVPLDACPATGIWDGTALLAVVAATPDSQGLLSTLSAPTLQVLGYAADAASVSQTYVPTTLDFGALSGMLLRLPAADRAAVLRVLPATVVADFEAAANGAALYSFCP